MKHFTPRAVFLCIIVFSLAAGGCSFIDINAEIRRAELREGDILFQTLFGQLCKVIEGVTQSPLSHCGIVVRSENGDLAVLEAISGGVRETPLYDWVARGRDCVFAAYRLKKEKREHIPVIIEACRTYLNRPYDTRYMMDDERIYCSELIYKGYKMATGENLGKIVALGSLNWEPYSADIEELEGGRVPLDRLMITPAHLSRAEQLECIFSNY